MDAIETCVESLVEHPQQHDELLKVRQVSRQSVQRSSTPKPRTRTLPSLLHKPGLTRGSMRLLNTETLKLEEFFDKDIPEYAILSHRWGKEEVSLQELMSEAETFKSKTGYTKIKNFCALAKRNGYKYGWVDTCSID